MSPPQNSHPQPYHRFSDRQHPEHYRRAEIQALQQAIKAKENRLVLGLPDVGLSNLLRFLVTRTDWGERSVTFAYLHCGALGRCLDRDGFFNEITQQLAAQGLGQAPPPNRQGYDGLRAFLESIERDLLDRIVVAVDKADDLLKQADQAFFLQLKALTDLNKGVCYVFAANLEMHYVAGPDNPLFAGREQLTGPFSAQDFAGAVAEEAQRLEATFDADARNRLAHLTGGHPGLLRAVSSAVIFEGLDLGQTESDIEQRLLARSEVQHRCQKVWRSLSSKQQTALHAVSAGESIEPKTLIWLQAVGLVQEKDGCYHLFSSLFQQFIAALKSEHEAVLPAITIKKAVTKPCKGQQVIVTGTVYKGKQKVHVSALELRLIACLQQEQRVYTKDEIAAYLYCEDEETDNVETAIFNLISQVRRRLGDKRYIKNRHGQGYEFQR
ncbi:MAG: winged helix-turn-helix transcriptional regulator [Anaerolineae bacterium]|nr:winged helix-turn-helix transcriptional regulator [Anaerolineae bacterium]